MLRIASSYSCIIVLQKGQRLGFPYSFKSQLCAPGIFCFCTISRVGCVLQARGGFPSPWPENVVGSFLLPSVLWFRGFCHIGYMWTKRARPFESLGIDTHADHPLKQQPSIGWWWNLSDLMCELQLIAMLTCLNFQSYDAESTVFWPTVKVVFGIAGLF